jgi:hypothetical protein
MSGALERQASEYAKIASWVSNEDHFRCKEIEGSDRQALKEAVKAINAAYFRQSQALNIIPTSDTQPCLRNLSSVATTRPPRRVTFQLSTEGPLSESGPSTAQAGMFIQPLVFWGGSCNELLLLANPAYVADMRARSRMPYVS